MSKEEIIEKTLEQVAAKKMSKEAGAWVLIELVYKNKGTYNLSNFTSDSIHELILSAFYKFTQIFDECSTVQQVLENMSRILATTIQVWKRSKAKDYLNTKSINYMLSESYEESSKQYEGTEFECKSLEGSEINQAIIDFKQYSENYIKNRLYKIHKKGDCEVFQKKYEKLRKEAVLILTLKSAYYMTDEMLNQVSALTEIPYARLKEYCAHILSLIEKKIGRRESCIKTRNKSYFFHNRYMFTKDYVDRNSALAQLISRKYISRTNSWEKNNIKLNTSRMSPVPSNRIIAKLLNTTENHIGYVLMEAKKNVDKLKISHYNQVYENLFGKWKCK